jgi:hypothetical protein
MSGITTGVTGAIALLLISAAQFAMGRDLSTAADQLQSDKQSSSGSQISDAVVNRGAKADRAAGPSGSPASLRTIALTPNGVSDTIVLMRVPAAAAAPSTASAPAKPVTRRPLVACEPVVSSLTEVARRLQPGRCVA